MFDESNEQRNSLFFIVLGTMVLAGAATGASLTAGSQLIAIAILALMLPLTALIISIYQGKLDEYL